MIDGIFKLYREDITMKTIFEFDPWRLIETELHKDDMRLSESMTSIGNGHMGMRGNFEERYSGDSHRGTYLAGVWFPDKTRVGWWKNGYPQYFGKVINAMNIISLRVRIDREDVDLYEDDVVSFSRVLDMRAGVLEFVIRREKGTVRVSFERFVSVARPELMALRCRVTADYDCKVALIPAIDADVRNEDSNYDETFWLFEGEDEDKNVWLIDKHAAHERVNFDRMKANQEPLMCQALLAPLVAEFAAEEYSALTANLELLREFGFECEEFGGGSLILRAIPADIDSGDAIPALEELADKLVTAHTVDPAAARDALLHTMACKAAIKGGWKSDLSELRVLVDKVQSGEVQFCPHGRPVKAKLTKYELEKMFKRA